MVDLLIMGQPKVSRYYNARLLKNHELLYGELWTANGRIISPQEKADEEIDAQGFILAPGYIDLQINGGFGIDFSTQADQVKRVAARLPQYGVTSFLPTLVSLKKDQYPSLLPHLQPCQGGANGSNILGIHLEGPFFHSSQPGAHNPACLTSLDEPIEAYYGSLEGVRIVTLAPELPGALLAIKDLKRRNIVVAAGHTQATYEEAKLAIREGIRMATHLFNAMPFLHHRAPGLIGAVLTDKAMFYSIIADGIHLHPAVVNLAWKANPKGLFLVTDAIAALGLAPGIYALGSMPVEIEQQHAHLLGTQTLAGSIVSMDAAVRLFRASTHCSLVNALEAASLKPAQVLGMEKAKGNLNEGADADFIFLDDDLYIQACYVAGELAWRPS
jgi:N-acetylglucosamine-6-phosphate deacetylase